MRKLPLLVLQIQRCWRGTLGRRRAAEQLAAGLRLRRAVRRLVRIHRQNLEHRRWRQKVLAFYHGGQRFPLPPEEQLLKEYMALENEHDRREAEVQHLRAELERLQWKVQQAKSGGFFASFARMCM